MQRIQFIGLRDTTRGLALVTPVAALLWIFGSWSSLTADGAGFAALKIAGVIALAVIVTLALTNRFRRFSPLGRDVVLAQFVASRLRPIRPAEVANQKGETSKEH